MQHYRFLIRFDHITEDLALVDDFVKTLNANKDFPKIKREVWKKETSANEYNERHGLINIIHGTPEELATFTEYEKTQ